MFFSEKSNNLILILIAAGVVVVLVTILICFIIKRNSKTTYLSKVDGMLNEINISNKPQLDAYINRLKNISINNDDFLDIYNQLSAQYEVLMNTDKEKLLTRQRGLKERILSEKRIRKPLLEQIKSLDNAILMYKKDISRIQNDLESFFKDGDELRVRLTGLQTQYQTIIDEIEKYSASISICKAELLSYLSDVEMHFDVFDNNISGARYKEAKKNLDNIEMLILNLYGHVETIAQYCNMIEVIIPQQMDELLNKNNELEKQGYVVSHARVNEFIENIKKILDGCKIQFKRLSFSDFADISYEIQSKFSEVHAHLDQEVVSRAELDSKYQEVKAKISKVESEFIKTKRQFHTMLEYYKLPVEINNRFVTFEKNATYITDLKREYEGYLIVKAKNPASFMLEKVSKMDSVCNEINDDIAYFINYFTEIKEYSESTYNKVKELLVALTKMVGVVRYNKCKPVYNKYIESVTKSISSLKDVHSLLMQKPIDIAILYEQFSNLVTTCEELQVVMQNDLDNYHLVEKCIVFANPLRFQFSEVDTLLMEIEKLFKDGNYKMAQEKLNYILNNYHPAAFDAFNGK